MSSLGDERCDEKGAPMKDSSTILESRQKHPDDHDAEQSVEHESHSHSPIKEIGASPSRTASPISFDQRNDRDEEKGLPVAKESQKDTTEVINAEHDPNIVDWEDNEPGNPYNWTPKKKWLNIAVLSALTLLTPLGSSFFAPAVPRVMADFNSTSEIEATFVVSVYLLGFAFGPLLIAPLSELHGRMIVYHTCNVGYLVFTVACALATNMNMLIGFRFLAGCFGVAPVTIGGGTVADMMRPEDRGLAMSLWASGALLGPVIGPVCGGFLSQAAGWRWIFWVLAIAIGVVSIAAAPIIRETYAPVLLERKTARLRKETGNPNLRSKLQQNLTPKEVFVRAIARPTKLLFLSPICGLMSLYMAVVYGILYLLFTTFTFVFQQSYGFSESTGESQPSKSDVQLFGSEQHSQAKLKTITLLTFLLQVGLTFLGIGIGNFIGLAALGYSSDRVLKHLVARNGGQAKPEYRLPPLIYGSPFIPIGLFIYGWTAQYEVHYIVPLFGTLVVGIGMIAAFMAVNTYLIDAFTLYAASAIAANTILRSVLGAVFPLFGLQMYNALGLGWGNSLLGFVSLALCAIPVLFYYYGEKLRTSKRFKVTF